MSLNGELYRSAPWSQNAPRLVVQAAAQHHSNIAQHCIN